MALSLVGDYMFMSCVCRHLVNACEKYISSLKLMVISDCDIDGSHFNFHVSFF